MPPSAVAAMAAAQAAANKKNKKKQTSGLKLSASTRPMKTSALYAQDNNTAWSAMYTNRFESIKAGQQAIADPEAACGEPEHEELPARLFFVGLLSSLLL